MTNKLSKLIEELSYGDLALLKKDHDKGNIGKLIAKFMKEKQHSRTTICPVCNGAIKESEGFHLQFGPPGLRKKATFDGVDCMQYFLENLNGKNKRNTTNKKSKIEDNMIVIN